MRKKEIAFLIIITALLVIGYGGNYGNVEWRSNDIIRSPRNIFQRSY